MSNIQNLKDSEKISDKTDGFAILTICDNARGRPRTCTAYDDNVASSICDCGKVPALVTDLAINSETRLNQSFL
jgi:hypothetical protein